MRRPLRPGGLLTGRRARALLASTGIPTLFQAVEIAGRFYWDGGYAANPALLPLVRAGHSSDLMLIQLLPEYSPEVPPRGVDGIMQRAREMGFSTHLLSDFAAGPS